MYSFSSEKRNKNTNSYEKSRLAMRQLFSIASRKLEKLTVINFLRIHVVIK